ncbi:MAG: AraC family transcriptional regulator [Nevskia sp.]|nr:AraC family transcriptional regulator [Nevskia sp.]
MAFNEIPRLASHPPDGLDPLDESTLDRGRQELVGLIDQLTSGVEGTRETGIAGLRLHRIMHPGGPKHGIQLPALALIAQGSKQLLVGGERFEYDPLHYLVLSVDLPAVGKVTVASATQPYLGLGLDLDVDEIAALIRDENLPPAAHADTSRGLFVNRLNAAMLDAVLRLLRLLQTPRDIPILAPLVKREILYRLLLDGHGARLRQIALQDSQTHRVARAIRLLRERFEQPLRMETIARDVHMSVSSLHHHFKAVTAMSPLQYQKHLRLQEGRRLLLLGDIDVATAAHRVGYESPSQFSREYSRLFGASPLRDRRRWLEAPSQHQ